MTRSALYLRIPGEPRGQARARHGKGFTYTDKAQQGYALLIQGEWVAAGRPVLAPGPYRVEVRANMARPKAHFRKDGTWSAKGLRHPHPTKTPDADNLLKQVDALVALGALPDDAAMVEARVWKLWATWAYDFAEGEPPSLEIYAVSLNGAAA